MFRQIQIGFRRKKKETIVILMSMGAKRPRNGYNGYEPNIKGGQSYEKKIPRGICSTGSYFGCM